MCSRFTLTAENKELLKQFALTMLPELLKRHNIAPGGPITAIRQNEHSQAREFAILNWGLVPSWAKDPNMGHKLTNARCETAADKPAFRGPMRHHRCLIPANGFFEWKRVGKNRLPYYFKHPEGKLLALAGLWEYWASPDGSEIQSCTILTTEPNALMRPIHQRMPVLIEESDYSRWLDTTLQRPREVSDLLKTPSEESLICHPVSQAVNQTRNDSPDLLEAVELPVIPEQSEFELF